MTQGTFYFDLRTMEVVSVDVGMRFDVDEMRRQAIADSSETGEN